MQQAALTSFVQQGMLEVQVMAEKRKEKKPVRGDQGTTGHGTHFSNSISDTLGLRDCRVLSVSFSVSLSLCTVR